MSGILDSLAASRYKHDAGTGNGTATVPAGYQLTRWCALPAAGGATTVTITPRGAGQDATAQPAITLPASSGWFGVSFLGELGPGTTVAFTGAPDSWFVTYAKIGGS